MAEEKTKPHLFQKGNPGRPKGAKGKKKLLTVEEILLKHDVNPIEELINIARDKEADLPLKKDCWKEVSKYTFSQKKAVEGSIEVDLQPSGFIVARA